MGARQSDVDLQVRATSPAVATARRFGAASDAELADALCGRENEALEEAFRRHGGLVASTVRRIAPANYVDDIVQIVFLALWRTPERFRPERGSLATYLVMLTRGKAVDAVRSDQARQHRENGFPQGRGDNVEDVAMAGVNASLVQMALRSLPVAERVAIELAFFRGETYRAVAAKLGHPEGTTKSRIRTGLRRLEGALQGIAVELD